MPMTKQQFTQLVTDPATSNWLISAIQTSDKRDMLDALRDAETLVEVLKLKCRNHLMQVAFCDNNAFAEELCNDLAL
jgi:hypothetical protein